MTIEQVPLRKDVIDKLQDKRREGESISDVISRLLGNNERDQDLSSFFGRWKDVPDEVFEVMEAANDDMRKEFKERFTIQ